jgi:hypothetical protein
MPAHILKFLSNNPSFLAPSFMLVETPSALMGFTIRTLLLKPLNLEFH